MIKTRTGFKGRKLLSAGLAMGLLALGTAASAQTLYVSNASTNSVTVIRPEGAGVIANIPVGNNPRSIAVSPDGTKAYTANAASNTVSVIDTATRAVTASYPVGSSPYHAIVSPDGTRLYVANYSSSNVSVLNAQTGSEIATITVGGPPIGLTLNKDGDKLFVSLYSSTVGAQVYNTSDFSLYAQTSMGTHSYPGAATADNNLVLIPTVSGLHLYNISTKSHSTTPSLGFLHSATYNTTTGQYAAGDYDGSKIHLGTVSPFAAGISISTLAKPTSVVFNPAGTKIYATMYGTHGDASPQKLVSFNTNGMFAGEFVVGGNPTGVAYHASEPDAVAVPTLTEWTMILLAMVLAGFAAMTLQRRRQSA